MVNTEKYRKGAHNVTELKYHFVWKTKYAYHVLVRRWDKEGRLVAKRTLSHRRYYESDVRQALLLPP